MAAAAVIFAIIQLILKYVYSEQSSLEVDSVLDNEEGLDSRPSEVHDSDTESIPMRTVVGDMGRNVQPRLRYASVVSDQEQESDRISDRVSDRMSSDRISDRVPVTHPGPPDRRQDIYVYRE